MKLNPGYSSMRRLLVVALVLLLGSLLGCAIDRLTTPADELRSVLGYYRQLEAMESTYFNAYSKYGNLSAILPFAPGNREFRVRGECQGGYCLDVTVSSRSYVIRIVPYRIDGHASDRLLSLYADQTHIIRVHYGRPAADEHSEALSQQQIEKYAP